MSSTLYRKYRPKNFGEIIGQKHIVQTLSNAVLHGRIGQAYLFTGPRGTGKTSIARILAKTSPCENPRGAITGEKCAACRMIDEKRSLDIIEIDAASNTGVDNIRELRETIGLPPTSLKYKVYIIDEVHMLSSGAFNALLKTLEEPPAHVIFILATTEIHKVPETIISRCQRFDFARLPIQNIIEKLVHIAKSEKIEIEAEALEMIAISAEGGMRDAESLFAQVIALEDKKITVKEVEEILGTADRKFAAEMVDFLIEKNSSQAITVINQLLNDGYDLENFNKTFINYLRQLMLLKINPELKTHFTYEMTEEQLKSMLSQSIKVELPQVISAINLFLEAQNRISSFMLPQLPLEIAIIKATQTFPASIEKAPTIEEPRQKKTETIERKPASPEQPTTTKQTATDEPALNSSTVELFDVRNNWKKLLEQIQPINHSLKALLFNCQAIGVESNEIVLATPYDFYKEKINDGSNRLTIEQVFGKILGSKISIKVVTNKEAGIADAPTPQEISDKKDGEQTSLISSALEIMGAKVVEE